MYKDRPPESLTRLPRGKYFLDWNQNKKTVKTLVQVTHTIINIKIAHNIFESGLGVVGLPLKIKN